MLVVVPWCPRETIRPYIRMYAVCFLFRGAVKDRGNSLNLTCSRLGSSGCSRAGTRSSRRRFSGTSRGLSSVGQFKVHSGWLGCSIGHYAVHVVARASAPKAPRAHAHCPLPPLLPESWPVLAPLIGPVMRATSWRGSSSNFTRPSRALFFIWTSGLPTSHLPHSTYRAVSVFLQKHPRRAHAVDPSTPSPNVRSTGRRLPRRPTLRLEAPTRPIDLAELWSAGGIEGPSRAFVSKALHFASCGRRPSKPNLQDGPFLLLQPPITEASPHNTRQKIFPTSAQARPPPPCNHRLRTTRSFEQQQWRRLPPRQPATWPPHRSRKTQRTQRR